MNIKDIFLFIKNIRYPRFHRRKMRRVHPPMHSLWEIIKRAMTLLDYRTIHGVFFVTAEDVEDTVDHYFLCLIRRLYIP